MAKIACTWENGRKRAKDGLGGGVIRKQVEDIGSVGGPKLGGVRRLILDGKDGVWLGMKDGKVVSLSRCFLHGVFWLGIQI